MKLELLAWRDGTVRLYYEDRLEGKDRVFVLLADGQAFEEDADDIQHPVDLVAELRKMALAVRAP